MRPPFPHDGQGSLQKQTPANNDCRSYAMGLPPAPNTSVIPSSPGAFAPEIWHFIHRGWRDPPTRLSACDTLLPVCRWPNTRGELPLESCLVLESSLLSCLVWCPRPLTIIQLDAFGSLSSGASSTVSNVCKLHQRCHCPLPQPRDPNCLCKCLLLSPRTATLTRAQKVCSANPSWASRPWQLH